MIERTSFSWPALNSRVPLLATMNSSRPKSAYLRTVTCVTFDLRASSPLVSVKSCMTFSQGCDVRESQLLLKQRQIKTAIFETFSNMANASQSFYEILAGHPWQTSEIIKWDEVLSLIERAGPTINDKQRCNIIIGAANGEQITRPEWTQLVGVQLSESEFPPPLSSRQKSWLIANMDNFVTGTDAERANIATAFQRDASGKVARFPIKSKGRGMRDHVIAKGVNAALIYALSILFDPDGEFAEKLCRCGFSECGSFFWEHGPKGRPVTEWCQREINAGESHAIVGARERAKLKRRDQRSKQK
jgi:hypothetical protein